MVYNFKELILIIIGTKFNELYFHKRLNKLNTFYKDYMLLKICESDQQFQAFRHRPSLQIKRQLKIGNNYGRKISGRAVGAVGARGVYQGGLPPNFLTTDVFINNINKKLKKCKVL